MGKKRVKKKGKNKKALRPSYRQPLKQAFQKALKAIGPRNWWPGDTPFEIIVGAILTQNTAWKNVAKAIENLKQKDLLHPKKMNLVNEKSLALAIRSSGYYNMKAKKLKAFLNFFYEEYQGSIKKMKRESLEILREKLLNVHGIGPETADSILLYALEKPSFVVDAYTKRIFSRHDLFSEKISYDEVRNLFMKNLEKDSYLYNEYHALIVYIGHHYCKTNPLCEKCPWNWIEF